MEPTYEGDSRGRIVWLGIRALGGLGLVIGIIAYLLAGMVTMFARRADAEWQGFPAGIAVIALGLAALSMVLWIVGMIVAWWLIGPARWRVFSPRARRERLLAIYDEAAHSAAASGLQLVRVRRVYQRARRGTKAVVEHPSGARDDAWFWWSSPSSGEVLIVRGQSGPGTHHSYSVLYIGTVSGHHGIFGSIPRAAWRAHRRRMRRARRR